MGLDPATLMLGGSVVSGLLGADAAESAADTQAASADKAAALQKQISDDQIGLQREQFNKAIELQQPFREGGLAAQNQLLYLLGLSPTGSNATDPRIQSIRSALLPQYTESTVTPGLSGPELEAAVNAEVAKRGGATEFERGAIRDALAGGSSSSVERTNALDAAVQSQLKQAPQGTQGGPGFGSLMRDFSMADFQQDPGYQFRQQQGEQGLMRAAAASGRLGSGRYMKDAMRFNSGLADQSYGDAFNRFQINRSNKLNPLQSLMGAGQTSANTMGSYGQNFANSAGAAMGNYGNSAANLMTSGAAARAAGGVGAANAITGGIGQGISMYQQNQLATQMQDRNRMWDSYLTRGGSGGYSGSVGYPTGMYRYDE